MTKAPDWNAVAQLANWTPVTGVASVYIDLNPADRGEGWRVDLRHRLTEMCRGGEDLYGKAAIKATVQRIEARLPGENEPHPSGRFKIGFVEVTDSDNATEHWFSIQQSPGDNRIELAGEPFLEPLVKAIDDGETIGIVAVSSDRVRLMSWEMGDLGEIDQFKIDLDQDDWREQKGPSINPRTGTTVSSSGRDHFEQRLSDHRNRFLHRTGEQIGQIVRDRTWRALLCFGEASHCRAISQTVGDGVNLIPTGHENLVSLPEHEIAPLIAAEVHKFNRKRETVVAKKARDAAMASHGRGTWGIEDTVESLLQGAVDRLIYDADRDLSEYADRLKELLDQWRPDSGAAAPSNVTEWLLFQALRTSAKVTPVEGEAAALLDDAGGVAALLRYEMTSNVRKSAAG